MALKAKVYAKVIIEAIKGKSETEARKILKAVLSSIRKRGDLNLIGDIIRECEREEKESKGPLARIITSGKISSDAHLELKKKLEEKGFQVEEEIEPNIIGGTALFLGSETLIDSTVLAKLQKIADKLF